MHEHRALRSPQSLIPLLLLISTSLACSLLTLGQEPATPSPTPEPASEATATALSQDELPLAQDQPLNSIGPWLIFKTENGLRAVNPDGSGLSALSDQPLADRPIWQVATAPQGGHIAYLDGEAEFEAVLHILALPSLEVVADIPLFSRQPSSEAEALPGEPTFEAMRAIVWQENLAFSPDGRTLAFMGAIEGETSDLYSYSLASNEITRLTDGPSQGYQPAWSPDGRYIIHTGAQNFGTGAGYNMEGVWAAQADDSGILILYSPERSGAEEFVGWLDERTFLVYTWDAGCGPRDLRTFNIETQESETLWPDYFGSVAYDPLNKVALVGNRSDSCTPDRIGLYRVPADGSASLRVLGEKINRVTYSEAGGIFMAYTEFGLIAVDSNGQGIDLHTPTETTQFPAIASRDKRLAWPGDSLWLGFLNSGIDNPPQMIHDEPVYRVTWEPNGGSLLFFAENGFFRAVEPDFAPQLIESGFATDPALAAWVIP